MAADGLICEGDHLVLDVNGEKLSIVQKLKATGKIRVGKFLVPAAPLIGAPYGALFEVTNDGRSLQRVLLPPADEITRIAETEKNNSDLFDRNTENQKLTQEQIEELKKSGKAGAEIIQALCSNSATFQNKTEFSQDKYKKRKAKKYLTYLTVREPCARILCEAYYDKAPERVYNLRHDSLAVMMSLANVAAGAKVLVAEQCMGVLTAAAVERLGGVGAVCGLQVDDRPAPLDAVRQMNLSVAQRSVLFTAPAGSLLRDKEAAVRGQLFRNSGSDVAANGKRNEPQEDKPAAEEEQQQQQPPVTAADETPPPRAAAAATATAVEAATSAEGGAEGDGGTAEAMEVDERPVDQPVSTSAAGDGDAPVAVTGLFLVTENALLVEEAAAAAAAARTGSGGEVAEEAVGRPPAAKEEQVDVGGEPRQRRGGGGGGGGGGYGAFLPRPEHLRAVLTSGFDSCLVALPRVHPTALLAAVWPLLAPSATFAVFSPWAQPLAEAMSHLQTSRNAVLLQLQESWLRPYQVLPSRTHPHMTCSGTGGYVLSGIKIIPPDATPLELQLQFLYQSQTLPSSQNQQPSIGLGKGKEEGPTEVRKEEGQDGGGLGADGKAEAKAAAEEEEEQNEEQAGEGESPGGGRGGGGDWKRRGRGRGGRGFDGGWRGRGGGGGRGRWRDDRDNGGGGRGGGAKRKAEGNGSWGSPAGKRQAT
ncbi:hypothetical protein VOLCADRAFT_119181 [Volvox carteri f. nagariensis]|uniref:tRNA (adenine(58)-N(1))-methyltransferase non-catalytic subunit TRM6 n=1 Tax=Volvox carteri f. nagariensis TaxID=3068 RepID=D8UAV1_VOLCA|nr:uncharacterized protein VOLCADRAFT_119181 [Volvox carteri f. nagariensis]EFJ43222.1 hypothetical protein VOLCADRAFT_119181 [Volvox carteri f. nagariensis]|eukprot:XP_002955797.1 hypothetical protein VOLCADRAFT_119181 [Volvox carteri f. nagariensis]